MELQKANVGLSNVDNVKQATKVEFDEHLADKANPHGVTKSQAGLGSVQNYGIATQAEAENGTVNNKYMTPLRSKQAIDKHTADNMFVSIQVTRDMSIVGDATNKFRI